MAENSNIGWTHHTFNIAWGCWVSAGEFIRPQIAVAYETGTMPKMLPWEGEA